MSMRTYRQVIDQMIQLTKEVDFRFAQPSLILPFKTDLPATLMVLIMKGNAVNNMEPQEKKVRHVYLMSMENSFDDCKYQDYICDFYIQTSSRMNCLELHVFPCDYGTMSKFVDADDPYGFRLLLMEYFSEETLFKDPARNVDQKEKIKKVVFVVYLENEENRIVVIGYVQNGENEKGLECLRDAFQSIISTSLNLGSRQKSELGEFRFSRTHLYGNRFLRDQQRIKSSYVGNLVRRIRSAYEASEIAHLTKLYHKNDPKAVISLLESRPSLHSTCSAFSEYVKALVKVDRLGESEMLKTLQKGIHAGEVWVLFFSCIGVGVRRVRDLFAAAKKSSPCIISIDEVDVIRGSRNPKDQQNMWRTLNQLLIEQNEFKQKEGVILIAEINFPKSLDKERTGVLIGTGMGGITVVSDGIQNLIEKGYRKITFLFILYAITNMSLALLAIELGFMGLNCSISTVCATSNCCFYATANHNRGEGELMIDGGIEAAIFPIGLGGCVAHRTLSQRNNDPRIASRPSDKDRDGFKMGEGAGVLIMGSLEHAMKTGASILVEYLGGAVNCDSHLMTDPRTDGFDVSSCIERGPEDVGVSP